jgi:alpha-ketoglutarate-dependent taurine dioxygenase
MNISYANNGWTVFIDNDIKTLTNEEILHVGRLTVSNMCVVFKKQVLTPEDELRICSIIGKYQYIPNDVERVKHIRFNDGILRVTGKKNEAGEEGLFGHTSALDWHANQTSNKNRMPLIWLYGVEGTSGSRTSWINNIASYEGLSDEIKNKIKDIKVYCGYKSGSYSSSNFFVEHVNRDYPINLVQTNKEGKTGLYFPFLQIFGFEGYDDYTFNSIMTELKEHVLKPEYCYHHMWDDGDIVLSEQWLSIHKRWEFEHMDKRVLHRIAFNYDNLYPQ